MIIIVSPPNLFSLLIFSETCIYNIYILVRRRNMDIVLWIAALLVGVWGAHWGADQLAEPLKKIRRQWGFSDAGEAALAGIAAASPEVAMATVSAFRGVGSIGLGATLGTNIIATPLIVTIAYIATHIHHLNKDDPSTESDEQNNGDQPAEADQQNTADQSAEADNEEDDDERQPAGELRVPAQAATVQAFPYLFIILILAILTLPREWRGLQPIDGWILLAAYGGFLAQALFRERTERESLSWERSEILWTVAGFLVLCAGAYAAIWATENIAKAMGLSEVIGGLFIAAPIASLPEVFEAWSLVRTHQLKSAIMTAIGDHAVTLTLAFLPLSLISTPIDEFRLYWVNLVFVTLMPLLYGQFIIGRRTTPGFKFWQVVVLNAFLLGWIAIVIVAYNWLVG
jgi:cation:H+ antiporter